MWKMRPIAASDISDLPNWPTTCLKRWKKAKRARFLEIKSTSLSEKRLDSPHECELVHEQLDRVQ